MCFDNLLMSHKALIFEERLSTLSIETEDIKEAQVGLAAYAVFPNSELSYIPQRNRKHLPCTMEHSIEQEPKISRKVAEK